MSSKSKKGQRISARELSGDNWEPLEYTRSRVTKELKKLKAEKKQKKQRRHRQKNARRTRT